MAEDEVRSCTRCGLRATTTTGGLPEGWSLATERRGVLFLCGTCTRTNLRAIEGKLDDAWWDS